MDLDALAIELSGGALYRWQSRLLGEWFARGRAPTTIDVPTGLGKTKVIALWLAALASGAALPRRLVYVVDRRAVVDQATTEAEAVANRLKAILADESLPREQREAIRRRLGLTKDDEESSSRDETLPISTLRGAHLDNRRWLDRCSRAAIVVGTVDMIGSRLLFSGYGVSRRMRPVHAGLLACDSLFAIDESHLVPPFEALLRSVERYREASRSPDAAPRSMVVALSATSASSDLASSFRLEPADRADEAVELRLTAEKRLTLSQDVPSKDLAAALAAQALAFGAEGRRVLVFANSRKDAKRVHELIGASFKKSSSRPYLGLLVGERRLRERERPVGAAADDAEETSVRALYPPFAPGAHATSGAAYLVATSAGEVGVDLDADDLVVDLVAWERMVQRFGRVNRRPDPGRSRIVVIPAVQGDLVETDESIEELRLSKLRAPFVSAAWPVMDDGSRDASPAGLMAAKAAMPELIAAATTPPPLHPSLTRPVVEAWAMTQLREHPGRPLVAPWLRGWVEQRPQTSVVWRRRFPLGDEPLTNREASLRELSRFFEAASPHASEVLDAPTDRVARWLKSIFEMHAAGVVPAGIGDEDAEELARDETGPTPKHPVLAIVLDGKLDAEELLTKELVSRRSVDQLVRSLSNRTLVVDARLGGLGETGLLEPDVSAAPPTIDDDASWATDLTTTVQRRIRFGPFEKSTEDWRPQGYRWLQDPDGDAPLTLWVELWRGEGWSGGDAAVVKFQQGLETHHLIAECEMRDIAETLGLADGRASTLAYAAAMHDGGKRRARWQEAMHAPEDDGRPYAKVMGGSSPAMLDGYRHEFGSLSEIGADSTFAELESDDERDLALHLVAAHHGRARPTIAAVDPDSRPAQAAKLAREVALRYAALQAKIGAWDLAWWETVLKSADWRASRIEKP